MKPDDLPQWREMDVAQRNIAYSPSSALDGPIDPFITAYIDKSRAAYAALPKVQTIAYGPKSSNTIDFVHPGGDQPVPLLIFLHGGYWQELSKTESFFPAPDTLKRGMAYAAVDYTLTPDASLDDITAECVQAVACLAHRADDLGVDPSRIVLSGSSAGAHLAAMCCLTLPRDLIPCGVVLLSGVFDLEPLLGTYINDAVGMDAASAARNSPAHTDLLGFPPTLIAWGRQETDEFKRQSRYFGQLLAKAGTKVALLEMPARNHFDIAEDLANDTDLGRKLAALVGLKEDF